MNETSTLYNWVIAQFQDNELVNTISIVPTSEMDINKENIYPLVNVDLIDFDTQPDAIIYNFIITVIQQRDIKPIKIDSKLLTNTNYIDNINETGSISNRFINVVEKQNNDANIELVSVSTQRVLKEWGKGMCDGVRFNISLSIPNIGTSC
jgi:hypothetical protein